MASVRAPATGELLSWARRQVGLSQEQVAKRLNKKPEAIEQWEEGVQRPTLNQLRALAAMYRRTPAFFFLQEPPEGAGIERPPDFRAHGGSDLSPSILREIAKADERRKYFIDLTEGDDSRDLDSRRAFHLRAGPTDLSTHLDKVAQGIRKRLDVSVEQQMSWPNYSKALSGWIRAVERVGVLVFHMSRIDPDECRGLSLYREPFPIVVLNGAESPQARIFTLAHELGHLVVRASGVCDVWNNDRVEVRCNAFAGALLLPREDLLTELGRSDPAEAIPPLAAQFNVSQSAVAVRLKNLHIVDQDEVDRQLALARRLWQEARERQKRRKTKGGPPHHKTHLRNLSGNYVSTVLQALDSERISPVDASYFLDAKLGTIEDMRSDLLSGVDLLSERS